MDSALARKINNKQKAKVEKKAPGYTNKSYIYVTPLAPADSVSKDDTKRSKQEINKLRKNYKETTKQRFSYI